MAAFCIDLLLMLSLLACDVVCSLYVDLLTVSSTSHVCILVKHVSFIFSFVLIRWVCICIFCLF